MIKLYAYKVVYALECSQVIKTNQNVKCQLTSLNVLFEILKSL